ncbi:hypothetical protein BJ138DRAFT_1105867 [Hygrophoropsis aurantiaca]|uniref:Uncharacterized protein n=1 Tax=Hygrophoropsis aurantiaca TaxID=72124 RepID=A0ACB7ZXA3_9AGAM|nr:hypothetical protein BJ138DRAFT_1105867 [Hygrophoropsis aurantiaca]
MQPPTLILFLLAGPWAALLPVQSCWSAFKDIVCNHKEIILSAEEISLYDKHGLEHNIECNTRYCNNYRVHHPTSTRTYYSGIPSLIKAAKHFFIDIALLELFAAGGIFGWLSSMNYVYERYDQESLSWQYSLRMRDVDVLNGPREAAAPFCLMTQHRELAPVVILSTP